MDSIMKYWECECCGLLAVTYHSNDMADKECVFCKKVHCKEGKYIEINLIKFCKEAEIKTIDEKSSRNNRK